MKRYSGTLYKSEWGAATWNTITLLLIVCVVFICLDIKDEFHLYKGDKSIFLLGIACGVFALCLMALKSVYYRIDGDKLLVYQFFWPNPGLIIKIEEIKKIKRTHSLMSILPAFPEGTFTLYYTNGVVSKCSWPFPDNSDQFIKQLLEINPKIIVKVKDFSC